MCTHHKTSMSNYCDITYGPPHKQGSLLNNDVFPHYDASRIQKILIHSIEPFMHTLLQGTSEAYRSTNNVTKNKIKQI
jgi:hypothetical protein